MIKCPSCNHENVDGTTFCEMCGEELQAVPVSNGAATAADSGAATGGDIKCPACENLNPLDNVVCEVCGTELRPGGAAPAVASPATTATAEPVADTAASTPASTTDATDDTTPPIAPDTTPASTADIDPADDVTPVVDTAGTAATGTPDPNAPALKPGMLKLVVEQGMSVGKQFVLGDEEMQVGREDEDEDIYPDIDLADQDEGYVHRKHATLKFENDQLFVMHLGGANKTRVNNKPIPDNQPQAVKPGDKIAFGKVVLRLLPL
jgi:pSer/pThr/pTyr-binding forkhead associated (FHA) protein